MKAKTASLMAILAVFQSAYGDESQTQLKKILALQQAQIQRLEKMATDAQKELALLKSERTTKTFFLGGQLTRYYPVFFPGDDCWSRGHTELSIVRPNAHTDGKLFYGTLGAHFVFHSSQWGHYADFIKATIAKANPDVPPEYPNRLLARYQVTYKRAGLVAWLRGNTTYGYNGSCALAEPLWNRDAMENKLIVYSHPDNPGWEEAYLPQDTIESTLVYGGERFGPL